MRAAFYTLGCKVNQVETQAMERLWEERGHTVVDFSEDAEAYVVNTCSVTAVSDRKSRQMFYRIRREHPEAVAALCGCYAQTHPSEAAALGPDLVGGSGDRAAFVAALEQAVADRAARKALSLSNTPDGTVAGKALPLSNAPDSVAAGKALPLSNVADGTAAGKAVPLSDAPDGAAAGKALPLSDAPDGAAAGKALPLSDTPDRTASVEERPHLNIAPALARRAFEPLPAGRLRGRTRAFLKVEDGCANFCTYCIIPYARGPVCSAPLDTAVDQARELAAAGVREIVLTGIEISSWGRDLKTGLSLVDLTEAVCRAVPDTRIRLGSLEPRTVTEEFCQRTTVLPNLCPQFHLSLQSGCDDTLRRMGRKYDTARFAQSAQLLRRYFPRPALTTDLIAGFPGETEAEFSQTLAFLDRCAFARVHVFPYSPRPGTPAAGMEQVPAPVKEDRTRRAAAAASRTRGAYLAGCVGQTVPVLFERPRDGRLFGRAPNYMEVLAAPPAASGTADLAAFTNQILPVRLLASDADALYGEIGREEAAERKNFAQSSRI